ncbi:hypothetical protein PDENDC454_22109, partial [Paenibacillus dendritiformis C454]
MICDPGPKRVGCRGSIVEEVCREGEGEGEGEAKAEARVRKCARHEREKCGGGDGRKLQTCAVWAMMGESCKSQAV